MPVAYPYDVEVAVGKETKVCRVYAYDATNAAMQVALEQAAMNPGIELRLLRVGPPRELHSGGLAESLLGLSRMLGGAVKPEGEK